MTIPALLLCLAGAGPLEAEYPRMKALTRDDPLYVQLQAELDAWYRTCQGGPLAAGTGSGGASADGASSASPLAIFAYERRTGDDLFSLNARLNLPYDALATLNGAASRAEFESLSTVLVPTRPGLFVSDPPQSALEDMMLSSRLERGLARERLVVRRGGATAALWFFPGASFNAVERAYFLQILYVFPLLRGTVTSRYGSRADPFTGDPSFHNGIDIAAPEGTPVRAARDGTVAEVGRGPVLGAYVVITHPGGWQTVYGHLSSVAVAAGAKVALGALVGGVGSTGKATGPHLHFEVRRKGNAVDPSPLLVLKND